MTPRHGGGAIVAGDFRNVWLLGEVDRRGRLDSTFGDRGWALLPFEGEATNVVQERSGLIVVAGNNGFSGCCTENWAAAVSARGDFERQFGAHGRATLPTGEDSGIDTLALEPNGDLLIDVGYGLMGCWGEAVAKLTPSGKHEPVFDQRIDRFWHRLGFAAFVGRVHVAGDGFALVGTGQKPCAAHATFSAPSATGLIARFGARGRLLARVTHFPPGAYEYAAFGAGTDTVLVESPYFDQAHLTVTALRADGSVDRRFGNGGRARIRARRRGRYVSLAALSITKAGSSELVLVAELDAGNELQIIRLRI